MRTTFLFMVGLGVAVGAGACGTADDEQTLGDSNFSPGATSGSGSSSSSAATTGGGPDGTVDQGSGQGEPGVLTAGAWDDNRNYDFFLEYLDDSSSLAGQPTLTQQERDEAHARSQLVAGAHQTLDVALVVDTTGSMGDEIAYLEAEFDALSTRIDSLYPMAEQRWSLVVYRDVGDAYVTAQSDFTGDLAAFQAELSDLNAQGGGDYPEAADAGLAAAQQLTWREGDEVARLLFWVADAPHHAEQAGPMTDAIRAAAAQDVHVYPVSASGIDELGELTMRSAAQLTLGRYLFLTDDSGIGGEHKEPTLPCYFVTHLDDAILRMVDIEMSGVYREPYADAIIRTGGDPEDGRCVLEEGTELIVF